MKYVLSNSYRSLLQESLDIHDLIGSADCQRCRVMYALSKALEGVTATDIEVKKGVELCSQAEKIRESLQKDRYVSHEHSEVAYDGLVDGQLR